MILIELENAQIFEERDDGLEISDLLYEHVAINTAALNSIIDNYPNGCMVVLNGDTKRTYCTEESYPSILAKIKDAEDDWHFRNDVIRPWEDRKENKKNAETK